MINCAQSLSENKDYKTCPNLVSKATITQSTKTNKRPLYIGILHKYRSKNSQQKIKKCNSVMYF